MPLIMPASEHTHDRPTMCSTSFRFALSFSCRLPDYAEKRFKNRRFRIAGIPHRLFDVRRALDRPERNVGPEGLNTRRAKGDAKICAHEGETPDNAVHFVSYIEYQPFVPEH